MMWHGDSIDNLWYYFPELMARAYEHGLRTVFVR